jgi:hypothetical protein
VHDPMTVAFDIKSPFKSRPSKRWPDGYRNTLATIWHVDPERDGTDDSCGWFMRSRHGDEEVLKKIARDFEYEWRHGVPVGWFDEDGDPNYSPQAVTLGMFRIAANHVFGYWSGRANRFLRRHLFDILHFAENNCDSFYTFITRPYGKDPRETVEARAMEAARIVYPYILRADRPWWRHPRWHFWHWRLQIHSWQLFRRWLLTRCHVCGGRFRYGESPVGGWETPRTRWFRGEEGLRHSRCADPAAKPVGHLSHN